MGVSSVYPAAGKPGGVCATVYHSSSEANDNQPPAGTIDAVSGGDASPMEARGLFQSFLVLETLLMVLALPKFAIDRPDTSVIFMSSFWWCE